MAKRVTIEIVDDTNGSRAEQIVPFELDGVAYEIDLSATNANNTKQEPEPVTNYTATHDIRTWLEKTDTK